MQAFSLSDAREVNRFNTSQLAAGQFTDDVWNFF